MFKIHINKLYWINNSCDDPNDLCAHGNVSVTIGSESFEYDCTVSATALYLLKSLTENHIIDKSIQMLPCCGHSIFLNDDNKTVKIIGCPNGIDWNISHDNNNVILITRNNDKIIIPFNNYKKEVFTFVDEIEDFYNCCSPKNLPVDKYDKNAYLSFWKEWKHRRHYI